ncbi:single-stranded DNA-binding protein [Paraburkholderia sp. UCT31]|uniref:single-stranded DNA-binding protein n=1 Tax=Paraburkholderia sp. UCT31 TaxID=2615209 RepID=UPI0016553CA2|nr:single-stranded DNA-binding protein [Paraburkholderia sp. UCT31]MBC8739025.1 single-stranded DNA-binding protein [Paraburkholderia sp. UCT31]
MIDALVSGRLHGKPQQRTASNGSGKTFVTATLRCGTGDGEAQFVNVICFADTAKVALLALGDGDSIALCGSLSVGVWTPAQGEPRAQVRLTATAVLSPYHVTKRRAAVQQGRRPSQDRRQPADVTGGLTDDELDF